MVRSAQIWHVRRLALVTGLLLAAAFPAAASADTQPMPDDAWFLPPAAFHHPASSWPNATNFEMFDFTIYADFDDAEFPIELATSPDTDADGTLADANVIDRYVAVEDPRAEEVFTARTSVASQWLATLGTYYWQAHYTADDGTLYVSPIRTITITEQPAPDPPATPEPPLPAPPVATSPAPSNLSPSPLRPLTRGAAKKIIGRTIRRQTGRTPQRLTSRCSLPSATSARCKVSWRGAGYRYRARAKLKSTTGGILLNLDGTRTKRSCSERCSSAIHWSTAAT